MCAAHPVVVLPAMTDRLLTSILFICRQVQRRQGPSSPQAENISRQLSSINAQMKSVQTPLIKEAQQHVCYNSNSLYMTILLLS